MKIEEDLNKISEEHNPMGYGYTTYAEAARNRRSDEITIFSPMEGRYYNVKSVFQPKFKGRFRW